MRDDMNTKSSLNRRHFLKQSGFYAGLISLSTVDCSDAISDTKKETHPVMKPVNHLDTPNILVFFCDQLRIDLLGCYGGNLVRTPNIDSLASESTVFERAYTPCAICSPARASLMTGLYPHSHHMFNNSTSGYSYCEHLRPDLEMLPGWADKNTNYETAYFGKWHIGPAQDLFNSPFHRTHPRPEEDRSLPFLKYSHWHPNTSLGKMVKSYGDGSAGTIDIPLEKFPDVAAANYTKNFLRSRQTDRPFLTFCAFPGPHSPWLVPDEFGIRYDPEKIPIWPNRHDSFKKKPLNQKKLRMFEACKDSELKELLACNFSYLELIDTMVGEVIAELKKTGQYDDTTIIFSADHGDMAGSHGFISKGSYMYDEIYRIPLIIKPAGHGKPGRVKQPVNMVDVTATMMHLMHDKPVDRMASHSLQGKSLVGLMSGEELWQRQVNFSEYHGDWYGLYSIRMVTDGHWKLIWNFSDYGELYDLHADPDELNNLFYEESHRDIFDRYFKMLIEEGTRLEDKQIVLRKTNIEHNPELLQFARGIG